MPELPNGLRKPTVFHLSVGTIFAIIVQSVALVVWATKLESRVVYLELRLEGFERALTAIDERGGRHGLIMEEREQRQISALEERQTRIFTLIQESSSALRDLAVKAEAAAQASSRAAEGISRLQEQLRQRQDQNR